MFNMNNIEHKEKVKDCLVKSEVAAKHLLGVINDVLDFSSIDSGKIRIANEKFDIKNIVSILATMFHPQAEEKGVDFKISIENLSKDIKKPHILCGFRYRLFLKID